MAMFRIYVGFLGCTYDLTKSLQDLTPFLNSYPRASGRSKGGGMGIGPWWNQGHVGVRRIHLGIWYIYIIYTYSRYNNGVYYICIQNTYLAMLCQGYLVPIFFLGEGGRLQTHRKCFISLLSFVMFIIWKMPWSLKVVPNQPKGPALHIFGRNILKNRWRRTTLGRTSG